MLELWTPYQIYKNLEIKLWTLCISLAFYHRATLPTPLPHCNELINFRLSKISPLITQCLRVSVSVAVRGHYDHESIKMGTSVQFRSFVPCHHGEKLGGMQADLVLEK